MPSYYWTDSTTVLAWIQRNDEWGTFVGNRVREIIKLTDIKQWFHVAGTKNTADLPSGGCSPKELLQSRWREGSDWLKLPQNQWPNEEFIEDEQLVNAEKKVINKLVTKNKVEIWKDPWFAKKSSYLLCLRILAWINRLKDNCLARKRNMSKRSGHLTMREVYYTEILMVGLVQRQAFPDNADFINGLRVVRNKIDLFYVFTKVTNRNDVGRFKQPLLRPRSHPVVDKIIEEEHLQHGHAGARSVISKLKEKYWIVKTRRALSRVLKKCITCRRFNAKPATAPTAEICIT